MTETTIQVQNLSKKYILHHKQREQYSDLRDVIVKSLCQFGRRVIHFEKKRGVNPKLEEFWALKNVSFEVERGEVIGIIGHNGAGKSTLLKLLSRITEPTSGQIRIKGRVASLLEVGTGFHPELTGRENIYLNGAILGMNKSAIKNKFDEIVTFAEIRKFLDTPVKRYSSGMYVRLAFSVAAHLDPEILLVDEVLAVGDSAFKKKCLERMENVSQIGRTVVFVSHNMGAILSLCSRVLVMHEGEIIYDGMPSESVDKYMETTLKKCPFEQNHESTTRSLRKKIFLEKFFIKDEKGNSVTRLMSGKKYFFNFVIKATRQVRWDLVHMGFAFGTMQEIMLVYCDNAYTAEKAPAIDTNRMLFRCEIPKFPFVSGQYVLRGRLYYGNELVDLVDHFATIEVEKGMFYETGLQATRNPVMIDYKWNFEQIES